MWCGTKFGSGHVCMRSKLYQLLVEEPDDLNAESEEFSDCLETLEGMPSDDFGKNSQLVISLHALLGIGGPQTMQIQGSIKNHKVIILVDTGSIHNFIDHAVVKMVGCQTHSVDGVNVTVANGDQMWMQEGCKGVV